jgi:hypothetical protein
LQTRPQGEFVRRRAKPLSVKKLVQRELDRNEFSLFGPREARPK